MDNLSISDRQTNINTFRAASILNTLKINIVLDNKCETMVMSSLSFLVIINGSSNSISFQTFTVVKVHTDNSTFRHLLCENSFPPNSQLILQEFWVNNKDNYVQMLCSNSKLTSVSMKSEGNAIDLFHFY